MHVALIGLHNSVNLKFENNTSNIDLLLNFSETTQFSMSVNSLLQTAVEMAIVKANVIEITDLNNVNEMNFNVTESVESVTFQSIRVNNDIENISDTFYLSYHLPSENSIKPLIQKVENFSTLLIYDVNIYPTFSNGENKYSIQLKNCVDIEIDQSTVSMVKYVENSSIHVSNVEFDSTVFSECNITSQGSLSFTGNDQIGQNYSHLILLTCSEFSVNGYRSLFIDRIVENSDECKITCTNGHIHFSAYENNLNCILTDDTSYIYINEDRVDRKRIGCKFFNSFLSID